MPRAVAAVAGGLAVWIVAVTVANLAVRAVLPGYGEAEAAMRAAEGGYGQASTPFTPTMMIARLALGGLASVAGGAACAWIARARSRSPWVLGIILVVLFIPVHVWLWQRFPVWYHFAFLASLLPCTLLGATVAARNRR